MHRLLALLTFWVVVPVAVLGVGYGVDRWLGLQQMGGGLLRAGIGSVLVVIGVAVIARATRDLVRQGHGTPSPADPPRDLVSSGAYAWCRHPMFLGYDLAALGVVVAVGSWGSLFVSYLVFLWLEVHFLRHEETRLIRRFGPAYLSYRERTPMLVPHIQRNR